LKSHPRDAALNANFKPASAMLLPAELMEFRLSGPGDERCEILLSDEGEKERRKGRMPRCSLRGPEKSRQPCQLTEVIFRVFVAKWNPRREMKRYQRRRIWRCTREAARFLVSARV